MKKIICLIMILVIVSSNCFANVMDISNHWAYTDIERCINNEYVVGYPDGTFKPDNYIKWNEFIKILAQSMDDSILQNDYNWEQTYIDYARTNGLIGNENINYNEYITRKDVVNILYNYLKSYNAITQLNQLPSQYLYDNGILKGYSDNTLRLDNNITRAEAMVLLNRTIDFKDEYVYNQKTDISVFKNEDVYNYTNYDSESSIFLNTYNIKNDKIYYSDLGRYGIYKNVYISQYNDVVIDILLALINKGNYVLNTYIEENKCILIVYGIKDKYVSNGSTLFEILLFQEEQYVDGYKYKVKLNIHKLWKELNEIKNGVKYNEFYINKLKSILLLLTSEDNSNDLINTILEPNYINHNNKIPIKKVGASYYIYLK